MKCLVNVKYTDIDYEVFTDAATFVSEGQSPYERATYRYTPLFAYILLPNVYLWKSFGKVLFCGLDLLVGWLLYKLVGREPSALAWIALGWLWNPFMINISTRGNAESLVCAAVLSTLFAASQDAPFVCGLLHGISVHLKLYPIIY